MKAKTLDQAPVSRTRHWRDYLEVCKPKVVLLLVFTALVGMALSTSGMIDMGPALFGTLGIGLASASAAAINHVIDHRADAEMARTRNRPIPQGNLSQAETLGFALFIGTLAMFILYWLVNPLTAVLTFFSLIGYAVVYTMYLKRATPQNIVIGGAAGAMPPVLGWAAMTGQVTAEPLLLFLIIFIWTPPHFWALAIHRKDDYARVDIPMLPVTHGVEHTRLQVLLYTVLLVLVTLVPYLIGMSGALYLVGAIGLNAWFMYHVLLMMDVKRDKQPMRTFVVSIQYLMYLFGFLLVDHYLPNLLALLV
ncbi:MAG: heme o synthase [Granulosicoccaceae bacterium]